jgi:nucleoside-diphosphate-sugar epimerase
MSQLILVIGGTGAQGLAVVDALLEPQADGSPSPYSVRIFTRNPTHRRALELKEKGCELFQGPSTSNLLPSSDPHWNPSRLDQRPGLCSEGSPGRLRSVCEH